MAELQPERVSKPPRLFSCPERVRREEHGVAVVEFALVAIPLFLIVFGILDFGRALQYYNDLTQLAGQGARAAAVNQDPNGGPADPNFQNQIACAATVGELRKGINVHITTMPVSAGDPVAVQTSFTFNFFPFLTQYVGMTLTATQTERYESGSSPNYDPSHDVSGGGVGC